MPGQSSPQTLNGQLKLNTITAILLVIIFLLTLCNTSCDARHDHLRVSGKYDSSKSLPSKGLTEHVGSKQIDQSMANEVTLLNVKMELEASSSSSSSSSGGVRNTGPAVRVSQQLRHRKHKDDQGIHLDYAQPKTRTPCHN
uniref:Uncharacterized protein n=1 Tax=Oryza brachyantha TaxID=4533 RepID=J3LFJ4_ORYBR